MLRIQTFSILGVGLLMIIVASLVSVTTAQKKSAPKSRFVLSSPDAQLAAKVPEVYTANVFGCSGGNMSPPLQWTGAPAGTKSFVLTLFDPDEHGDPSGWWHWIVYNLPASADRLPKGAGTSHQLRSAAWDDAGPQRSRATTLITDLCPDKGELSTSLYLHRLCVERRETGRARRLQWRDGGIDREGPFVGEGGLHRALRALRDPIRTSASVWSPGARSLPARISAARARCAPSCKSYCLRPHWRSRQRSRRPVAGAHVPYS